MRKIGFKLLLIVFLIPILALCQADISPTQIIYPVANQRVHLIFDYEIEFVLKNTGTTSIFKNTIIPIDLLFDGTFYQTFNLNLGNSTLGIGDSLFVTIPAQTISSPNSVTEMCIVTRLAGDKNDVNDTICENLRFSLDNIIDLTPTKVDIVIPAADSTIEVGSKIIKMEGTITNAGNTTLPRDYSIRIEYQMYSTVRVFTGKTTTFLDTSGNFIINMGNHPKVHSNPGQFNVCLTILNTDDQNAQNDQYCETFTAVDYTGIDEEKNNSFSIYSNNHIVSIKQNGQVHAFSVMIFDMLGKQLYFDELNKNQDLYQIDLTGHSSNVIFVQVLDQQGLPLQSTRLILN